MHIKPFVLLASEGALGIYAVVNGCLMKVGFTARFHTIAYCFRPDRQRNGVPPHTALQCKSSTQFGYPLTIWINLIDTSVRAMWSPAKKQMRG